jgi:hypothetical protein
VSLLSLNSLMSSLNPLNPDNNGDDEDNDLELTPERLQETLNNYAEAFRQEFETSTAASPENVEEYTRDFFKRNIHSAAAQIVWLANNASSESVKLKACTTIVHEALAPSTTPDDPIKQLMLELSAND